MSGSHADKFMYDILKMCPLISVQNVFNFIIIISHTQLISFILILLWHFNFTKIPGRKSTEERPLHMPGLEPLSQFTLLKANLKPTNLIQRDFSCITKDGALHFMNPQHH